MLPGNMGEPLMRETLMVALTVLRRHKRREGSTLSFTEPCHTLPARFLARGQHPRRVPIIVRRGDGCPGCARLRRAAGAETPCSTCGLDGSSAPAGRLARSVRKLGPAPLCGVTIVVAEKTTDALASANGTSGTLRSRMLDELVAQSLVVSFTMVMRRKVG